MKDRRGFRYPLESYHKVCAWELEEKKREMLDLAAQERLRMDAFLQADQAFGSTLDLLRGAGNATVALDPVTRGLWLQYLGQLHTERQAASEAVKTAEQLRDEALQRYTTQHRYLMGLDAFHDRALRDFDQGMAAKEAAKLDEAWLQAAHWKSVKNADQE
ncbi:hypothetical protein HNQ59_003622 [Chitinivorax tropicus]|uniref:Flagellar FliJ protein n=1 Tax=Chitinivorax tropicus TaxID=714531 RepID=A0A840MVE3_9PROT|nr:hypothetical protein [Chitinivorax tropicus]MBB5020303.1 hypothetical protein [Chitinivorax tropicus]